VEQRLAAAKMIVIVGNDDPTLTVLGALVLAKDTQSWLPGAYVQFLRITGREWGDPIMDEQTITGTISDQSRLLDEGIMHTLAFFNNKGGVGKTSLVYHLAWMYAELGLSVIAADFDPQANLNAMFLDDLRLEQLWPDGRHPKTIFGVLQPLLEGTDDAATPYVEPISDRLGLLVGDLALSASEDELNSQWPDCLDRKPRAFRVLSAFWRVIETAAKEQSADLVLIDVGPNLGAINRAVLIAAQSVVIPLAPDLYSLQGLKNLGPTLRRWRIEWDERRHRNPVQDLSIPQGTIGRTPPTRTCSIRPATKSGRAGAPPAPITGTTPAPPNSLTPISCLPSTIPLPAAAPYLWRRNAWGWRATPVTSTRWRYSSTRP
jgi:cellulose biosynthesis protein BcsQ